MLSSIFISTSYSMQRLTLSIPSAHENEFNFFENPNLFTTIEDTPDLVWNTLESVSKKHWKYYPHYLPAYRKFLSKFRLYNQPARKAAWHPTNKGVFLALGTDLLFVHDLLNHKHIFALSDVVDAIFINENLILIEKKDHQELWDFITNKKILVFDQGTNEINLEIFDAFKLETANGTLIIRKILPDHAASEETILPGEKKEAVYPKKEEEIASGGLAIEKKYLGKINGIPHEKCFNYAKINFNSNINCIASSPCNTYFLVALEDGRIEFFQQQNLDISLTQGYLITKYLEFYEGDSFEETLSKISEVLNITLESILETWLSLSIKDLLKFKELIWIPNSHYKTI